MSAGFRPRSALVPGTGALIFVVGHGKAPSLAEAHKSKAKSRVLNSAKGDPLEASSQGAKVKASSRTLVVELGAVKGAEGSRRRPGESGS